jgi:hypothetical protein
VVSTDSRPNQSAMTLRSTPRQSKFIAAVCRSVCGVTDLEMIDGQVIPAVFSCRDVSGALRVSILLDGASVTVEGWPALDDTGIGPIPLGGVAAGWRVREAGRVFAVVEVLGVGPVASQGGLRQGVGHVAVVEHHAPAVGVGGSDAGHLAGGSPADAVAVLQGEEICRAIGAFHGRTRYSSEPVRDPM